VEWSQKVQPRTEQLPELHVTKPRGVHRFAADALADPRPALARSALPSTGIMAARLWNRTNIDKTADFDIRQGNRGEAQTKIVWGQSRWRLASPRRVCDLCGRDWQSCFFGVIIRTYHYVRIGGARA
jgi:hypothetical protein